MPGLRFARKRMVGLASERGGVTYSVKEMFYTLQGEGARAGRPSVFVRFAGCNLWSGREQDRAEAVCQFCDTQFVGVDGDGGGIIGHRQPCRRRVVRIGAGNDAQHDRGVESTARHRTNMVERLAQREDAGATHPGGAEPRRSVLVADFA